MYISENAGSFRKRSYKCGHPAGPELGDLLERLLDCVLKDPSLNTKEKLLEIAEKDGIKTE